MERANNLLSLPKALSFFRAVQNEDCFTIFWELADYSPEPVPFETICRTFGAEPKYLATILERLQRWGIARKAGRQWTVHEWAKTTLDNLEEMITNTQIEVARTASFGIEIQATNALEVATYDGFWVGDTSQVSGGDSIVTGNARTASSDEATELKSPELVEKPGNEARNHDYK